MKTLILAAMKLLARPRSFLLAAFAALVSFAALADNEKRDIFQYRGASNEPDLRYIILSPSTPTDTGTVALTAKIGELTGTTDYTDYTALTGSLTIPDTVVNGNRKYTVITIDTAAFKGSSISSVNVSTSLAADGIYYATLQTIAPRAFQNCNALTAVNWDSLYALTTIADSAFFGTKLTANAPAPIKFPKNVKNLGKAAFAGIISQISKFDLSGVNGELTSLPKDLFKGSSGIDSIALPAHLSTIGESAFEGCADIKDVSWFSLPATQSSLATISARAFYNVHTLDTLDFSASTFPFLTTIGDSAFAKNKSCNLLILGAQILIIGNGVFEKVKKADVSSVNLQKINIFPITNWLSDPTSLTTIILPPTITEIPDNAFKNFISLDSIYAVPAAGKNLHGFSSLSKIGDYAFFGTALKDSLNLDFLPNLANVGKAAFAATHIDSLSTGANLQTIGDSAFAAAVTDRILTRANFSASTNLTTNLTKDLFGTAVKLQKLYLPTNLTAIPENAFRGVSSLRFVNPKYYEGDKISNFNDLPSITSIGAYAFFGTAIQDTLNLVKLTALTSVGKAAFADTHIDSLSTGANLRTIGDSAFATTTLTKANFSASASLSPTKALFGTDIKLQKLYLPTNLTAIPENAFRGVSSLQAVAFPASLTSIGKAAFLGCTNFYLSALVSTTFSTFSNFPDLEKLTTISDSAFFGCTKLPLEDLDWDKDTDENGIADFALDSIGVAAFQSSGASGSFTFPNKKVSIGASAFKHTKLDSVAFPSSLTVVADSAFAHTEIDSVTTGASLGKGAFFPSVFYADLSASTNIATLTGEPFSPTALKTIVLPSATTEIPANAFKNFTSLDSIYTVPVAGKNLHGFSSLSKIGDYAFFATNLEDSLNLDLLPALTSVGKAAFAATKIDSLSTGAKLATIGDSAFATSTLTKADFSKSPAALSPTKALFGTGIQLKKIYFPNALATIASAAFHGVSTLDTVFFPTALTTIADSAFFGTGLKDSLDLNALTALTSVGKAAFAATAIDSVITGANLTTIKDSAFATSSLTRADFSKSPAALSPTKALFGTGIQLKKIYFPKELLTIAPAAFHGVKTLQFVNPKNEGGTNPSNFNDLTKLQTISDSAFFGTALKDTLNLVKLAALTSVGKAAFADTEIDSVITGANLTTIKDSAFATTSLTKADFSRSEKLTAPTKAPFGADPVLATLYLPRNLANIPDDAFRDLTTLKAVALPEDDQLITIGKAAFLGCVNFSTAIGARPNLPNLKKLTTISDSAFFGCKSLALPGLDWSEETGTPSTPEYALQTVGASAFERSGISDTIKFPNRNVSIGASAFKYTALDSVSLPSLISAVGDSAFAFTEIDSVTTGASLGKGAFFPSVTYADLSASTNLTTISGAPFSPEELKTIIFPAATTEIPAAAFKNFAVDTVYTFGTPKGNLKGFPNLTKIGDYAFFGTKLKKALTLDKFKKLTSVGKAAFAATAIDSVATGAALTSVGDSAFATPTLIKADFSQSPAALSPTKALFGKEIALQKIYFPKELAAIATAAFHGVKTLQFVNPKYYEGNDKPSNFNDLPKLKTISDSAFFGTALKDTLNLVKLTALERVGKAAFAATAIDSVATGAALTSVGDSAFATPKLTVANFSASASLSPTKKLFGAAPVLTTLYFPTALTAIPADAFRDVTTLKAVAFPNALISIGNSAFQNCTALDTAIATAKPNLVNLKTLESIGDSAFFDCTKLALKDLEWNAAEGDQPIFALKSIGKAAFERSGLSGTISLPNRNVSIGVSAFRGTALTSVTLPAALTVIPDSAFRGCKYLAAVNVSALKKLTSIGAEAFHGTILFQESPSVLSIPSSVSTIGKGAFSGLENLREVDFSTPAAANLTLHADVFKGCSSLEKIRLLTKNVPALASGVSISSVLPSRSDASSPGKIYMSYDSDTRSKFSSTWSYVDNINWKDTAAYSVKISAPTSPITFLYGRKNPQKKVTFQFWDNYKETSYIVNTYDKSKINISKFSFPVTVNELTDAKPFEFTITPSPSPSPSANPTTGSLSIAYSGPVDEYALVPDIATIATDVHFPKITALSFTDQDGRSITENKFKKGDEFTITATVKVNNQVVNDLALALTVLDDQETYGFDHSKLFKVENTNSPLSKEITVIGYPTNGIASFFTAPITTKINDAFGAASVDTSAAIKVPTFAVTESKIIPNNKTLFLSDEDFDNGFTLFAKIMADDTPLSIADQLIVVQSDGKAVRSTPTVEEHIKENITILPGMSFQSNIIVENGTDDNNSFISINKVPQHQVASGGGFTLNWPFLSSDDFGAKDLVVAYGSSTPAHPQFEFNGLKYEVIEESPLRKVKVVPLDPTQDPTYSALSESVTIPTIVSRTVEFEDQTKQTLQYSVTEIGTSAFRNCAYINSVTLPATIQKIGKYAFYGCTSASVTFAANSTALQTIGDFAFVGTKIIGALTLSVTSIGYSAFHKTDIAHLTLTAPSDATDAAIKADAFSETKIKNLSLTGPFDVSPGAFRQTPLATLTLNGVSPIERSFADIDSLRSVTFSGKGSVASSAFANCDSLKEISFASGSDYTLFASAFSGCGALTSLAWPVTPTLDGAVESLVDIGIPSTCTIYVPYNKIDELDEAWDWPLLKPTFAIEILEPKVCQAFSGQAADLKYRILRYGFPLSTDQNDPAHGVGFNSSFGAVTVSPTAEEGTAEATLSSDELTGSGSLTSSGIGTRRLLSDLDAVAVDTFVLSLPNTSIVGDQGVLSDTFVFKVNSPVVQTFSVVNPDEHPYAVFRKDTLFLFAHEKDLPLKNTVSLFGVEVPASPSVLTEWTGETSRTETHSLSPGKGADVGKVTFSAGSPDTVSYTVTATVNDAVSQTRFTAVVLPVDTFLNGISVSALSFATVTSTQSVTLSIGKIGVAANGKDLDRTIAIDPTKWVYPTDFFTAETDGNTITLTPKRFVSKDTTFAVSSPYFAFNGSNPNFISSGKRDTFRLTLKKPVVTLDVDTLWPYDKDHTGILLGTGRHASLTLKPKISFDGVLLTVADFSKIDGLSIVNSSIVDPNHSWVHWKQVDPTSDIITYKQNEQTANVTCYPSNLGSTSVFFSLSGWTIDNSPATLINIPELDKSLRILANGLFPDDNTVTLQPFGLGSSVTLSAQTVISGIPGQVLDSKDVTWTPSGSAIVFDGNTNTVSAKPIITNLGTFNGGGSVQADYRGYLTTINFIVPAPTITLDVMPAGGTNIFDQSRPISLKKGQPLSLRAVIKTDGQPREEFTGSFPVSWTVIENGTNVSLSSEPNGRTATLTPLTTGFDEYSAKIKVAALGVEHYIDVTIQKPELDLSLNDPAPINLFLNRSTEDEVAVTLLADKQPVDDPNAVALTWSSSDENVVKITPSFTGWATQRALKAVGVGAAQITVAIPGGAETTLPVVVPPPTINLFIGAPGSPNSTTSLAVHASLTLTTSLVIDDQTIDTAAVSWIHSAPGVLLETASGKKQTAAFTPLKIDGTVSLRAKVTVEGKDYTSNVITVNVTKPAVTFDPIPQGDEPIYRTGNTVFDTLRVGQEGKVLSLNLKLNDQDPDPIVPDVVWTSFNTAAITLSPTPSKLNVPDSASLSVLKAPDADSVIVSAKVAATGDSIRFRIHVTPPDVAIALLPGFSKELQIEDTLFLKATARYGSLPLPVSAYAWTASLPNAVKILTFSDRPDSIAVVAQHAAADSVAIVALPASGGRDSFRIKVIAPSLTLSPAIPQGQSLTTLKPLDQIELAFQAATTVDPPAVSRPLSDSTHKTALWSSSDSFTVLVNKNGLITARDTGLASVSLSVAGVNVSRLVYVPLPDSMRIAVSADTNKLFIGETLQLRTSVFVNGDEINFEAFPDPALADSFAPTWKSLDTVALATVDVDENGLLSIHPNRKTGDSVKIVAAVHAFGLTVTDTFIVYPQSKLGIDVLPLPASASAFIRPDGLYLSGFDPLDFISVFSVDGQLILRARPLNGHIPHPFLPHTPYILHTSKGAFKLISLPHKND